MQPSRIFIVDDEAPARSRLRDVLDDCNQAFPNTVCGEADNGVDALKSLQDASADIVLVDIRMPIMDGIEFAEHLQKTTAPPKLIFVTAFDSYAVKAFELNAVDYLLKPVRRERLLAALLKAKPLSPQAADGLRPLGKVRSHLSIFERGRIVLVPIEDVLFLRAELKYLTVQTAARSFLLEESLAHMEQDFPDRFVRVHRNCLVARKAIAGFERSAEEGGWQVVVKDSDERLPVSRRQTHIVKEFQG